MTTPITTTAKELIKSALKSGPLTTRSLHLSLHTGTATLPNRPPPRNFLAGIGRSSRPSNYATKAPGGSESSEGLWSMSYLKKILLKDMESRNEVIKLTRGKFERIAAISTTGNAPVIAEGLSTAGMKAATANLAKYNDEHIWYLTEEWNKLMAARETQLYEAKKEATRATVA